MHRLTTASRKKRSLFDDVLLKPGLSEVMPSEADVRTRLTRRLRSIFPFCRGDGHGHRGAAGHCHGAGRRHRRHPSQSQPPRTRPSMCGGEALRIRHGGRPLTIHPEATLAEALEIMAANEISGLPVVEKEERPHRQARGDLDQPRRALRRRSAPADLRADDQADHHRARGGARTKRRSSCIRTASRSCSCRQGLSLRRPDHRQDIEKAVTNPNACKDEQGRLRVAAATTVGEEGFERTERLIDAGVDVVVVDTGARPLAARARRGQPHQAALECGASRRRQYATREGAKALTIPARIP